MNRICLIAAGVIVAVILTGCEKHVVSEEYYPSTGMSQYGNYQTTPMPRNQPQNSGNKSWWDKLFGSDEPQRSDAGDVPGTTRTFKPVWDQYGNANQQPARPQ